MATVTQSIVCGALNSGDRMSREEFHERYESTPEGFRAELIGGTVYVASPLGREHGVMHIRLAGVVANYVAATTGVEAGDNATVALGDDSEPQPDIYLRILSEYGGASTLTPREREDDAEYIAGPPELICEIAHSSHAIDLHGKREDYARHGVKEYLVVSLRENRVYWFDLASDSEFAVPPDGVIRSQVFPGLWIDVPALIAGDLKKLHDTARAGTQSPEHEQFAKRLAASRQ